MDGVHVYSFRFVLDSIAMEMTQKIGKLLNLKPHLVGDKDQPITLYTPVDLEIHKGFDSKYVAILFLPSDIIFWMLLDYFRRNIYQRKRGQGIVTCINY